MLVIAIETEQVPALENANIDKFTRFQTFAQIAISCEWLGGCGLGDDLGRRLFFCKPLPLAGCAVTIPGSTEWILVVLVV